MYHRFVKSRIQAALTDTRVVLISGPRQAGKTTLAQDIAADKLPFFTLDDRNTLAAASDDPVGFLRGCGRAVIDEIQRAPELLLSIKAEVDRDKRPGRFLLTGSANLMTVPRVADSLAGRMEVITLLPLSRAEIEGTKSTFLDNAFSGAAPTLGTAMLGDDLVEMVLAGGYPEALTRKNRARRQDWYSAYVDAIVQRDIRDISRIEQIALMPKLLKLLAEHCGQLVNYSGIGSGINLNHVTTRKYLHAFETLFIAQPLQPWFTNKLKRLTKSPKLHFFDAGLPASLRDLSPAVARRDRASFGAVLETFVFSELQKIAAWSEPRCAFSHFRDKDKNEVDIVVENRRGDVIGVEVKSSATVSPGDFSGLRKLAAACGERFVQGLVLYDHEQVVPFAENMYAAPVSCLWSSSKGQVV